MDQQIDKIFKAKNPIFQCLINVRSQEASVKFDQWKRGLYKRKEKRRRLWLKYSYQENTLDNYLAPKIPAAQPELTPAAAPEMPPEEVANDDDSTLTVESAEEEYWSLILKNGEFVEANWQKIFRIYDEKNGNMLYYDMDKKEFVQNPKFFWKLTTMELENDGQQLVESPEEEMVVSENVPDSPESPSLSRQGIDDGQSTEYEYQPTSPDYPD